MAAPATSKNPERLAGSFVLKSIGSESSPPLSMIPPPEEDDYDDFPPVDPSDIVSSLSFLLLLLRRDCFPFHFTWYQITV